MVKSKFYVPESERKDFDLLVQRANRRIKSSLKYVESSGISSEAGQRALLGDYASQDNWNSSKTVFSRSKKFDSEKDYRQYLRHISQWGGDSFERSPDKVHSGYYEAVIKALTTTAIDNAEGVLTKSGRLPGNLAKKIKDLTLEQITHFFEGGDPTEQIEYSRFSSYDYLGVDKGEFIDITESHINKLKQLYPAKAVDKKVNIPKAKPKKRKGTKAKKPKDKTPKVAVKSIKAKSNIKATKYIEPTRPKTSKKIDTLTQKDLTKLE